MSKENRDDRYKFKNIAAYLAIALILLAGICIVLIFLNNGSETTRILEEQIVETSSISCTVKDQEDVFFKPKGAEDYSHEVKVVLENDKLARISYEFEASYESEKAAENDNATMDYNYGIYVSERGGDPLTLNPVFSQSGNKLKISLYAEKKKLSIINGVFFFLDGNDVNKITQYSAKQMMEFYKSKGFDCTYQK